MISTPTARNAIRGEPAQHLVAGADARTESDPGAEHRALIAGLSTRAQRVYAVLERHDGELVTHQRIAAEAGFRSTRTVQRAIAEIEGAKLVIRVSCRAFKTQTSPAGGYLGNAYHLSTRLGFSDREARAALSTRLKQSDSEPVHPAPVSIGGISFSSEIREGNVSPVRETSTSTSFTYSNENELTPQDEENVRRTERRLDSLVTTQTGRRDIAYAIRTDPQFVLSESGRLAKSPTAQSRAGVLIQNIRQAGLHVPPFENGRCRYCSWAVGERCGCVRCAGWKDVPILPGDPATPEERKEIVSRESERQEGTKIEREEREQYRERIRRMRAEHPHGEIRSAAELAQAALAEVTR